MLSLALELKIGRYASTIAIDLYQAMNWSIVDTSMRFVAPNTMILIRVFSMKHLIGFINIATCLLPLIHGTTPRAGTI